MLAIQTVGLEKRYAAKTAVHALNLEVEQGELFALLGVNGAGKTTTIKMLSCLSSPTGGDAFLLGDSVRTQPALVKQKINVSPQETAIAPNLSVRENLEMIAGLYGSDRKTAKTKAEKMLAIFGLAEVAADKSKTLSGGMQRRLSIAMALVSEPQVLFLDEPTLGLDVRARRDLWTQIERLKGRITVILTTHYLEEAEALADRIGIMSRGRMQVVGTVEEIKRETGAATLEDAFLTLTDEEVPA